MALNRVMLESLLNQFWIPIQHWGIGEAKTLDDLLDEISIGESHLIINDNGISRVVGIVKMFISNAVNPSNGLLIEWGQYLPDGRYRQRMQSPGGKIKKGESPKQALLREVKEELNIGEEEIYKLSALPVKSETRSSRSYPGLICIYTVYGFKITIVGGSEVCRREEFTKTESNGARLIFKWVK